MGEDFTAATQYGDLKGTAQFDGHEGPPLSKLAKYASIGKGYRPVGFELHQLEPDKSGDIPFTLVAVDANTVGMKSKEWREYAQSHSELPVYRFDGSIPAVDFYKLFKRVDIKVLRKRIPAEQVKAYRP